MKKIRWILSLIGLMTFAGIASAQPIVQVAPDTLTGTGLVAFNDVDLGDGPGIRFVSFDAVYRSGGVSFGERFAGQTGSMDVNNIFEVLSGAPLAPLALHVENPNENVGVFELSPRPAALYGISSAQFQRVGAGSFAVLFDRDQAALGFDLVGGDGPNSTAYIDFFRRDGSLIQRVTLQTEQNNTFDSLAGTYAFAQEGGSAEIAGFSVYGDNALALGIDNVVYDGEQEANSSIIQVAPDTLTGTGLVTFAEVDLGDGPGVRGVKFDSVYHSDGVRFGERFAGQTSSMDVNNIFEALSGAPLPPLALQVAHPDENIGVFELSPRPAALYGISSAQFQSVGAGSFAVLFDRDQASLGFELVGGNGSNPIAYIDFFRRDGSLIQRVTLQTEQNNMFNSLAGIYAFAQEDGLAEIAGFSVHGADALALGIDNLVYNSEQETTFTDSPAFGARFSETLTGSNGSYDSGAGYPVEMVPAAVPEPGTMILLGTGLVAALGLRRRRRLKK